MKPFLIPTEISLKKERFVRPNEDPKRRQKCYSLYMDVEISLTASGDLSKYYDKKKGTINIGKIMLDILLGEIKIKGNNPFL